MIRTRYKDSKTFSKIVCLYDGKKVFCNSVYKPTLILGLSRAEEENGTATEN